MLPNYCSWNMSNLLSYFLSFLWEHPFLSILGLLVVYYILRGLCEAFNRLMDRWMPWILVTVAAAGCYGVVKDNKDNKVRKRLGGLKDQQRGILYAGVPLSRYACVCSVNYPPSTELPGAASRLLVVTHAFCLQDAEAPDSDSEGRPLVRDIN